MNEGFFNEEIKIERRTAYLHITSKCNMNCIGCYSRKDSRNRSSDLTTNDLCKIIDNLASGGEPFLRQDLLYIITYAKKQSMSVSCITNGLSDIKDYRMALEYLDDLAFSLDGYSKGTSIIREESFNKIDNIISELIKDRLPISIIFTLHRKNISAYFQMVDYALSRGVPYNFSILTTENLEEYNEFLLTDHDTQCLIELVKRDMSISISDSIVNGRLGCMTCCGAGPCPCQRC